jgi:spore maturation protein CgeB
MKILIVGNRSGTNVGGSFEQGAIAAGHEVHLLESAESVGDSAWIRRWNWWFRGKRPPRLTAFSKKVVETCRSLQPACLLVTGIGPVEAASLRELGSAGVRCINYLTDDPWNRAHYAQWFFQALPHYNWVFSTRRANLDDLRKLGCPHVAHMPFAYDPEWCFPDPPIDQAIDRARGDVRDQPDDIVFAGSGDRDRIPYLSALVRAGFRVGLYGAFWDRYRETRGLSRGQAGPAAVRSALGKGKVALCLVRRANRDGHVMRTFEVPAAGACMLAEDTDEHREILGEEGCNVLYFDSIPSMIEKTRWLLDRPEERQRLATAAYRHITQGGNTYGDRLVQMLDLAVRDASRQSQENS